MAKSSEATGVFTTTTAKQGVMYSDIPSAPAGLSPTGDHAYQHVYPSIPPMGAHDYHQLPNLSKQSPTTPTPNTPHTDDSSNVNLVIKAPKGSSVSISIGSSSTDCFSNKPLNIIIATSLIAAISYFCGFSSIPRCRTCH